MPRNFDESERATPEDGRALVRASSSATDRRKSSARIETASSAESSALSAFAARLRSAVPNCASWVLRSARSGSISRANFGEKLKISRCE